MLPALADCLRFGVAEARCGCCTRQHKADRDQQAIEGKTGHRRGSGGTRMVGSARLWGRDMNRDHLAADRIEDGDGHHGIPALSWIGVSG